MIRFHNTEYVEPPLPDKFRPGYVLTQEDIDLVLEHIGRRDDRIRMLYDLRAEHDEKMRKLWAEYEYYRARSRT
jgi:hypothetical protein